MTDNQVKEIYQSLLAGVAAIDLARLYGVEQTTIGGIKRRTKWKHITEDLPVIQFKIKTERQSETKVHQVCKMLELGILPTPIANELSVPVDLVYDLKRRKGFNHITSLYNW